MKYVKEHNRDSNYVSVNTLIQPKKYNGISAFPPCATAEQKQQTLEAGVPLPVAIQRKGTQPVQAKLATKSTGAPIIQRHVTFNPRQPKPAMLGCGLAGYGFGVANDGRGNIDIFIEKLESEFGIPKEQTEAVLKYFFGDEHNISFIDFVDAAEFVKSPVEPEKLEELVDPRVESEKELKAKAPKGLIAAYRVDGSPKSEKQASDVQKLAPHEAFNQILTGMDVYGLQERLQKSWQEYLDAKDQKKFLSKVNFDYRKEMKTHKEFNPSDILSKMDVLNEQLKVELANNERLASRVQIGGSFAVPRKKHSSPVTGISTTSSFNFSVGFPDHAIYFNSTFTGKNTQVIKFYLKKDKWAEWKIKETGPQEKGIGPSAPKTTTTLNDINKPGVKYEVGSGDVQRFFETVVAREIPAEVIPMEKELFNQERYLGDSIERLKKANGKLTEELKKYKGIDHQAETEQNSKATDLLKAIEKGEVNPESLYEALNLTKNALHSIRRKMSK